MLEMLLPFLQPENETQRNISYGMKLYQAGKLGDSLTDRLFPTRREELEQRLLERQLEAMGEAPDTERFNSAVMAQRAAPAAKGFLAELFSKSRRNAPPFSVADALRDAGPHVDFRLVFAQNKAGFERDMAKRAISKGLKAL